MLWLWVSVISAFFLGLYDIAKKYAVGKTGVLEVLFLATGLSTLLIFSTVLLLPSGGPGLLAPELNSGSADLHLKLLAKSILVTVSWVGGIVAIKHLPLTTVGIVKASRPVFVLLGCLLIFGESLNMLQWAGVLVVIASLYLLGRSSRREGIRFGRDIWVWFLFASVIFGVASALFDKYLMEDVNPLFVQAWCNFYISLILLVCLIVKGRGLRGLRGCFVLEPSIFFIALFISISDFCYFYSLSVEGSLLSVISMLRRSSVVITFAGGAVLFGEKNLKAKAFEMLLLLVGMVLLMYGSY